MVLRSQPKGGGRMERDYRLKIAGGEPPTPDRGIADAAHHYARLMRFVRARFRVGVEADDVVQDAYLRLFQSAGQVTIRDTSGFLHKAARSVVCDRERARQVRRRLEAEDANVKNLPLLSPSVEREIIAREQLSIVEKALAELPAKQRATVVMHRFDHISHAEIAERLDISISMVEKHIRRALAHCRARLDEAEGLCEK